MYETVPGTVSYIMTSAVIFDMDGVLVDSYAAHFASWREACAERGVTMTEAAFAAGFGRTGAEVLRELWPGPIGPAELAAIEDAKEQRYRAMIGDAFPAVDGARELVESLAAAGFRLAVGSSGPPENVALVVDRLGLAGCFGALVTGRDVVRGKPDPQVFALAAERLGVRPEHALVVEDAAVGIAAAHAAGMLAVGYVGTGRTAGELAAADLVVRSLRELDPAVVRELLGRRRGLRDRSRS
jgi:beta-phosphoglucomutase